MAKIHFNQKTLEALKPPTDQPQVDFWDMSFSYFGIRVSKSGRKTWTVMYAHKGRLKRVTLGQYGAAGLSLAEARKKAKEVHHEAANGIDPASVKKQDRMADSYADLVDRYIEWAQKGKSSWEEDKRILHRDVLPEWRNLKAKDITRKDVIRIVDAIVKRGAGVHANRTFSLIRRVFNFAIEKDILQFNPCQALKKPTKEKTRERVLSPAEIRDVWRALEGLHPLLTAAILKMQFFTAQRPGEVLSMAWTEVDLESKWWTIPGAKTKNGLAHRVPLTESACALLNELSALNPKATWVFPSDRGTGTHIGTAQKLVERVRASKADGGTGVSFTAHDVRRTVASHMTGFGIPRLVVSKLLNHQETGVTRVYDRHSYDSEKRAAMDTWSKRLTEIIRGKDVLTVIASGAGKIPLAASKIGAI